MKQKPRRKRVQSDKLELTKTNIKKRSNNKMHLKFNNEKRKESSSLLALEELN